MYTRLLATHPIATKTLTSAFLFGAGDLMTQTQFEKKSEIDLPRFGRMVAWGGLFAPLAHVWYGALDRMIPGAGVTVVASKVIADQLTWTVFINCAFFWSTTVMETGDSNLGIKAIQDKLWPTLKVNWVVWPVLQTINLGFVPLEYRLLYINIASLFWSAYLSKMAATKSSDAPSSSTGTVKEMK
jgi:protein Mpv17